MRPTTLVYLGCLFTLTAAALTGCSPAVRGAPHSPSLAFAAPDPDAGQACAVVGPLEVLDSNARFASPKDTRPVPVVASIDDHRRLEVWMDGSIHTGLHVRAQTAHDDGGTIGAPLEIAHEGSAIGRPTVSMDRAGHGMLFFVESNGRGFQLVAARLDCSISP